MGQRHQIFVVTRNDFDNKHTPEAIASFGSEDKTILTYHHGWLYGRNVLTAALSILEYNKGLWNNDCRVFTEHTRDVRSAEDLSELARMLITTRVDPNTGDRSYSKTYATNFDEPEMRHDFTRGDNNDGVTIIDTFTNSYCFLNIGKQEVGSELTDVSSLPHLIPQSALQYVKAYYPEQDDVEDNLKIVHSFAIGRYPVLTTAQLIELFPKLTTELTAARNGSLVTA